tara:strand:- start:451 stop:1446 length:996 start_codon:yes stop_codon:yes gene_type:complete
MKYKAIFNLILILLVTFLLIEVILYIFKPSVYEYSKSVGWQIKKNYNKEFKFKDFYNRKYKGTFKTNKYGARQIGDEVSNYKILVIGDSFTMDPHTGNDQAWFGILKHGLEKKYKKKFLISAIGGGGYGTNQQYIITKDYLKKTNHKHDLVILQFCINDFMNNSFDWETKTENYSQFLRRPYYVDGNHYFFLDHFLGNIMRNKLISKFKSPNYFFLIFALIERKYFQKDTPSYIKQDSLKITHELLMKLNNLFNNEIYVFNCKETKTFPENQWSRILTNSGFNVLENPSVKLNKISKKEKIFFKDGGHYNELGNKILGNFILDEIIERNLF